MKDSNHFGMVHKDSFEVVLASASPRRAQLLKQLQVDFTQRAAPIDERQHAGESPVDYVRRMAMSKALAAPLRKTGGRTSATQMRSDAPAATKKCLIIASDTTVVMGDECLGKPKDIDDFMRMMRILSGQRHEVYTAVSVRTLDRHDTFLSTSAVWLRPITEAEMHAYWMTGEPVDKAGGYAIQGLGGAFVSRLDGSYSSVMGLPIQETAALLTDFGVSWALNGPKHSA